MALQGRALGPGCPGDDPSTGYGIAVLVEADRRLNFRAGGREQKEGKRSPRGARGQFNVASCMRPRHVNAVPRGEKLPLKSICACVFRHKSTKLPQITRISLKRFTRIQVRAAPRRQRFHQKSGKDPRIRVASRIKAPQS